MLSTPLSSHGKLWRSIFYQKYTPTSQFVFVSIIHKSCCLPQMCFCHPQERFEWMQKLDVSNVHTYKSEAVLNWRFCIFVWRGTHKLLGFLRHGPYQSDYTVSSCPEKFPLPSQTHPDKLWFFIYIPKPFELDPIPKSSVFDFRFYAVYSILQ